MERIADILTTCCFRSDCGECGETGWQSRRDATIGNGKGGEFKVQVHRFDDDGKRHRHQPVFDAEVLS